MKLLAFKCRSIGTKLTFKSTRPKEKMFVEEGKKGQVQSWGDSTAVFFCVEEKDETNEKVAENAVRLIKGILKEMNTQRLVLIPFVHLAHKIASPRIAYRILKEVERRFMSEQIEFSRFQFGWHRDLTLDLLAGNNKVRYMEAN